jgi:peptide/nickel transport system ATP-binding protein
VPADPMLVVRDLSKTYVRRPWGRASSEAVALRNVSFAIARGRTLGLVGRSGSGKSTLARCLSLFEEPTSGEILLNGQPLAWAGRRRIQLIFQQPGASLNPRFTAAEIVEEPLVIAERTQAKPPAPPRVPRIIEVLELVGLSRSALSKRPHEFSGGERQRLAIARALVVEPPLLILDESFAGLDPALQDQIAALLRDLQQRLGLSYLLIAHDLSLVAGLAHDIAVMERGEIVEQGEARQLLEGAAHLLTRELIAAARTLSLDGAVL